MNSSVERRTRPVLTVIAQAPPLVMTRAQLDECIAILQRTFDEVVQDERLACFSRIGLSYNASLAFILPEQTTFL